jgi:hypothetical protein
VIDLPVRPGFENHFDIGWLARSSARLSAYKLVARIGATTKKPEIAPASNQNRLWAMANMAAPPKVNTRPWAKLIHPQCAMSRHAHTSQCMGRSKAMVRTCGSTGMKMPVGSSVDGGGLCMIDISLSFGISQQIKKTLPSTSLSASVGDMFEKFSWFKPTRQRMALCVSFS